MGGRRRRRGHGGGGSDAQKERYLMSVNPLKSLVPSRPLSALAVREQQRALRGDQIMTFCDAAGRLARAKRAASSEVAATGEGALVLFQNRAEIAKAHDQDALEEFREAHGLQKVREDLLGFVMNEASFERGLEQMLFSLLSRGIIVDTWEELNMRYPDLTVLEVSLIGLLEGAPVSYIGAGRRGTGEIPQDMSFSRELADGCGEDMVNKLIASLYGATTAGLLFVFDSYDHNLHSRDMVAECPMDAYSLGGVTGRHEEIEFVPFRPRVRKAFERLILLAVSNRRIHQQVFRESEECFTASFGTILRMAYEDVAGKQPLIHIGIRTQAEQLPWEERRMVDAKAAGLEKNLCKAKIFDLTMGRMLSTEEVFRLIALIDKPPPCLFAEEGFTGYTGAYGLGVRFIRESGEVIAYSRYRDFFAQRAVNIVYGEQTEAEKSAGTMGELFGEVYEGLMASAAGNAVEGREEPTSLLEDLRLELYLGCGIDLAVFPRERVHIREADPENEESKGRALVSAFGGVKQVEAYSTRKIGYEEAQAIVKALGLLPRELLAGIKRIEKEQDNMLTLEAIMQGMVQRASYNAGTKTIRICESPNAPFNTQNDIERYVYVTSLLHEAGESAWAGMAEGRRAEFAAISGWAPTGYGNERHDVPHDGLRSHFLSAYSHLSGPNDDFAEHFSFYVMHAEEFREKAASSPALAAKYAFLKSMFTLGGKATEYPKVCDLTIGELHGKIEQEIQRQGLLTAKALQEMKEKELFEGRRKRMAEIKRSKEQMDDKARTREEELDRKDQDDLMSSNSPFFRFPK